MPVRLSVRPSIHPPARPPVWNNLTPTGWIFIRFYISGFFENLSKKFKFHSNMARIMGTLHADLCTFLIISHWTLLRMRNIEAKVVDKIKMDILYSVIFFQKSYHLWDNVEKYGTARQSTDDNIIWCMCFACWITKAVHTPRICDIISFPQQQWLSRHTSMLRYSTLFILLFNI
jgi:hypothetical protein